MGFCTGIFKWQAGVQGHKGFSLIMKRPLNIFRDCSLSIGLEKQLEEIGGHGSSINKVMLAKPKKEFWNN
jgi:hypothetical protein